MRSVFEYLDYREILKDAFEERKLANPFFSYRLLADLLGLDSANTFRILHGDCHLPTRSQPRALAFLELSGRSAEYFLALIAFGRERNARARGRILEQAMALRDVAQKRLADHELDYYKHWWIVAVRSLLEVVDGQVVPDQLATRLRPPISGREVEHALEVLLELGLAKRDDQGRVRLSEPHVTAGGTRKVEAIRGFQRQILSMASESLERFPKDQRDVSTLTFAVDREGFEEIREMLRETRRQIQMRIDQAPRPDRVIQLAMALFPLAPSSDSAP